MIKIKGKEMDIFLILVHGILMKSSITLMVNSSLVPLSIVVARYRMGDS